MKQYIVLLTLLMIALLIGSPEILAQPPAPVFPQDVPQAPIDGGLSLLAAAGVSYSAYRLRKKKKA